MGRIDALRMNKVVSRYGSELATDQFRLLLSASREIRIQQNGGKGLLKFNKYMDTKVVVQRMGVQDVSRLGDNISG